MYNRFGMKGWASLLFAVQIGCLADETNAFKEPTPKPVIPTSNFRDSFRINKGFRIELATLESMVSSPAAMAFDEKGRLFVAEMRDYPDRRQQIPHVGRISLFEDADGDGVFDSSHIYADNLPWPSAIACYDGGIFVAATPDIFYFKDTSGNGLADLRKVVFTGFGTVPNNPDQDALINSFVWGLDNRIHGGSAGIGGVVTVVGAPGNPPITLGHNDFAFDPKTLAISVEGGPARTGLCFDSRGRKYVTGPTHPLQTTMFDPRYFARSPFVPKPLQLVDVLNPGTKVFRFVPEQPGGLRTSNRSNAPAWMTKARGCLVYQGNAFPSNFLGNIFICDPDLHVIHRSVLIEDRIGAVAQRPKDEQASEFLVSKDADFHPTQLVTGPDGAIYVADMQNGGQSGRILRIVPEDFKPPKPPQLSTAKTYDLVATLAHPNEWNRETASRLLYQRHDPASASLLTNVINNSKLPLARLHALHALDAVTGLNEAVLIKALRDPDERVREHAVALCERLIHQGQISDTAWGRLATLSVDPSVRVQYQLAFTLGEIERPERTRTMAEVLQRNFNNIWFQSAILSSAGRAGADFLVGLASEPRWKNDPAGLAFLSELALTIGVKGQLNEVAQVINFLNGTSLDQRIAFTLLYSLGEGLHRIGSSLTLVDPQGGLQHLYDRALQVILDDTLADTVRIPALHLWGVSYYTATTPADVLHLLFGTGQSEAVQAAALTALSRYENPMIATNMISRWPELPRGVRRQAVSALLLRTDRAEPVLTALENRSISPADFSSAQANFLRTHRDPAIGQRAVRIFGPITTARPAVIAQFKPSLTLSGASARGREIFLSRCASCHRLGGEGYQLGPDLAAVKLRGKEKLLAAIIEPNRELAPGYATSVIETRRHENLIGIVTDETGGTITLRQPSGVASVWSRSNIQTVELPAWSLMPDSLEQGLNAQTMADLLEYLMNAPN